MKVYHEYGLLAALALMTGCVGGVSYDGSASLADSGGNVTPVPVVGQLPEALQVTSLGGPVLTAPQLQIVTFGADPMASQLADFGTKLAASSYWKSTTEEYGVGALKITKAQQGNTLTSSSSGGSITDGDSDAGEPSDIETYLAAQLDGSAPPWGAGNPNTIYALFLPSGAKVTDDGNSAVSSCDAGIYGWHTAMVLPKSQTIISYIVVPDCGALGTLSELDSRTAVMSYEIVETATNPQLNGYGKIDADHAFWQIAGGGAEVGSLCVAQQFGSAALVTQPADMPYVVQRTWSNAAAKAGRPPCVPADGNDVLFDAGPQVSASVAAAVSANPLVPTVATKGIQLAAGAQGSVSLDLYSDGDVTSWDVAATEVGSNALTLSLSSATGNAGQTLQLSITVNSSPPSSQQELVRITSTSGNKSNSNYILVHQ